MLRAFAQTTLHLITSRFTHRCCTQNICCSCWQILRIHLHKKLGCKWVWVHQTLSFDAPSSFAFFNYLLVLFIAELFSSAALLLHWWSAQASVHVPRAPWLTLLLLLLCVLYVYLCPGQQEQAQDGELPGLRAVRLPVQSLTRLNSTPKPCWSNHDVCQLSCLSHCYLKISINHVLPPPATKQKC